MAAVASALDSLRERVLGSRAGAATPPSPTTTAAAAPDVPTSTLLLLLDSPTGIRNPATAASACFDSSPLAPLLRRLTGMLLLLGSAELRAAGGPSLCPPLCCLLFLLMLILPPLTLLRRLSPGTSGKTPTLGATPDATCCKSPSMLLPQHATGTKKLSQPSITALLPMRSVGAPPNDSMAAVGAGARVLLPLLLKPPLPPKLSPCPGLAVGAAAVMPLLMPKCAGTPATPPAELLPPPCCRRAAEGAGAGGAAAGDDTDTAAAAAGTCTGCGCAQLGVGAVCNCCWLIVMIPPSCCPAAVVVDRGISRVSVCAGAVVLPPLLSFCSAEVLSSLLSCVCSRGCS